MSSVVRRRVRGKVGRRTDASPEIRPLPLHSRYQAAKALPERCLALVLLVLGLPIMALTVLAVRLTSRGAAIYRQTRVGLHGRSYVMYKIRTMRVDAESATGPVWTQICDPRITPLGHLVRKLHLDEFPQLINVLKGEMALVGPRPERPEFTQKLALEIPGYLDRLSVLPGITGLAQINLPPDTDFNSVRRKLELDLLYVRDCGPWLDAKILACTLARLFCVKGRRVTRLFGVDRCGPLAEFDLTSVDLATHGQTDGESPPVDLLIANIYPKTNGHAHKRGSEDAPNLRPHPR